MAIAYPYIGNVFYLAGHRKSEPPRQFCKCPLQSQKSCSLARLVWVYLFISAQDSTSISNVDSIDSRALLIHLLAQLAVRSSMYDTLDASCNHPLQMLAHLIVATCLATTRHLEQSSIIVDVEIPAYLHHKDLTPRQSCHASWHSTQ